MAYTLYYFPGACSMAPHITLLEAGLAHKVVEVNLQNKMSDDGTDLFAINSKGNVPVLRLPTGEIITEGAAIMQYIADYNINNLLPPVGDLNRYHVVADVNFVSAELHRTFGSLWTGDEKLRIREFLKKKFDWVDKIRRKRIY